MTSNISLCPRIKPNFAFHADFIDNNSTESYEDKQDRNNDKGNPGKGDRNDDNNCNNDSKDNKSCEINNNILFHNQTFNLWIR